EQALEFLNYVNDNYLAPGGLEMSENELMLIASDKQRAMEYSQSAINGEMDPYFKNRYKISPN
ncbi:MAG: hypothetical protein ACQESG_08235, partial [Nanobdellota archaeon]